MQSPASLTISKEALSALRRRIRVPLHQMISYAEIVAEDAGGEQERDVLTRISGVITACEALLQITTSLQPGTENVDGFIDTLGRQLLESCQKLRALTEELQKAAPANRFEAGRQDIEKLHLAAAAFETLVHGINTASVIAMAESDTARPSGAPAVRQPSEIKATANGTVSAKRELMRPGLVLVVDDDEGNRDVLSRRLLRDGCEVMLAETGRQALRMAHRYNFDLVLLDIMMPEMDGISVLAELKNDPKLRHLPVIMISAVDEIESVVRCIELGASDYLPKPFNPVILRARINALLERKYLQDSEIRKAEELEKAVAEIAAQQKNTEELLLNILPRSVAEELRAEGSVQPMYFEDVTIAFADFVGFTLSTEHLPADELVTILHRYFTAFDSIIKRYGLEKMKTIGDCYMFAAGLPVRSPSHPVDTILAAFEMVETTRKMAQEGPVDWQLRIGVHTGPVVAGVVGTHKFAFDIWGDSVNFSSRMESAGAPGRINLSANTHARVKDFFSCEKRERVRIKDGREVDMYFVNGIAAGLMANKNAAPLKSFEQRYRAYFRKDLCAFPVVAELDPGGK